jgi:serine/threonine-protein kinase
MAEVYLARRAGPHGFQKIVAVKRILPQYARDPDFVAMFVDEARVCARLGHPNIVQVFDFGEQDGELYMAMEYVDGTTGARLIRAAAAEEHGEVPLDVCLHVAISVLRGLEYAHTARDDEGRPLALVHRDVSPGNVLIDRSGAVKLTDFGIARAAEIERRTDAGQLKGKLGYMSPEQVLGRDLDARSDIFTLGIVLAEMIILRPLFSGGKELDVLLRIRDADVSPIDRAGARVPDDVRAVLFRALSRDPVLRWAGAGAFADALEDVVRRRRLQVGPSRLAALVDKLGLLTAKGNEEETRDHDVASTGQIESDTSTRRVLREGEDVRSAGAPSERQVSPRTFRVKRADGSVMGPLTFPAIIELFAVGEIGGSAQISQERGKFKPASDYPELARFLSSPALQWEREFPADASDKGQLDPARLPTRIFHMAVRRETGALVLKDGPRKKRIFFVEGSPECVTSTERTELLGEFLIRRGQVLRMEVEMALAMLPRFGGRIGDALVGVGVLRPIELFRAIHDQVQERLIQVFTWKRGEMSFSRGIRSHEETFPLGVDLYELVGRGIRHGYPFDELQALLAPVLEEAIEPVTTPPVRLEMFRLPDREAAVIEALRTKTTASQHLAQMTRGGVADPEETYRALFLGLACDLLRSPKRVVPPSFIKAK